MKQKDKAKYSYQMLMKHLEVDEEEYDELCKNVYPKFTLSEARFLIESDRLAIQRLNEMQL